ncbi:MAG: putative damage-inducible protein DinB, partial [Roseivirga sp.]
MRKTCLFFSAVIFSVVNVCAQYGMTEDERNFAVKHLTDTQNDLIEVVKGLSDEQMNFKPNAESWSVAECLRHITLSEQNIWAGLITVGLAMEADPSKRAEVQITDGVLLGMIESRKEKVKTFAPFEPENKTEPIKEVLKEFNSLRKDHILFMKESDDNLRNRYADVPMGRVDL